MIATSFQKIRLAEIHDSGNNNTPEDIYPYPGILPLFWQGLACDVLNYENMTHRNKSRKFTKQLKFPAAPMKRDLRFAVTRLRRAVRPRAHGRRAQSSRYGECTRCCGSKNTPTPHLFVFHTTRGGPPGSNRTSN